MKKIIKKYEYYIIGFVIVLTLFLTSLIFTPVKANEKTINIGVQNGVQTNKMTIDDGLELLGYKSSDFQITETIKVTTSTDLKQYFGENGGSYEKTPIEIIGITESYEYIEKQNFIDTYVYLYTPYEIDYSASGINEKETFIEYVDSLAIMFQLNSNKLTDGVDGWWLNLKGYPQLENNMSDFEQSLSRAYVTSEDDNSESSGVVRLRIRVYTDKDFKLLRNYYVEKLTYQYEDYATSQVVSSNVTPSINTRFSAQKNKDISTNYGVDVEVEYDEEFTDSTMFTVKNKSVVCVEAECYLYRTKVSFGVNRSYAFILLRNKETGSLIENCKAMQILFRLKGDPEKEYRTSTQENLGDTSSFKIGNAFSVEGQFNNTNVNFLHTFEKKVIPQLESSYQYEQDPQYVWWWNKDVVECYTVYVWYEVEAGTVVQGSAYENGLHVEYDENGKALGVFDKDGNKVEDVEYNENGLILNKDGSIKVPENSDIKVVVDDTEDSLIDKLKDFLNDPFGSVKNKINDAVAKPLKILSYILGIGLLVVVIKFVLDIWSKISIIKSNKRK
jgi:hypothetical protein